MKPHSPVTWLASLFAAVAVADPLSAQSPATSSIESVVELSPFVVNSTKDTGYQASNTLAGTRLDTPLKNLGAAISIYTREFLEDIGATNTNDLLIYATGMEAGGMGGNFSSAVNDINNEGMSTNRRDDWQGTSRSRGLSAPTFTRGFFPSIIDIDSYNTDRVTVLRGPNSALIGVSSPAGIVDTALSPADVKRNTNRIVFRYGNNDSRRAIVDFNRVLIPDKLAVRLIGLQAREEYNQRPAYEEKERLYGAITYRPFSSTTLRAYFETGNMEANQPVQVLLNNSIANEWYLAGRPGFDWTFYDDPARNPLAASQVVNANLVPYYSQLAFLRTAGGLLAIYNNNSDPRPGNFLQASFPTTTATVANAIRAGTLHPLLNRDLANDTGRFVTTRNIAELPEAVYWIGGNVLPGQQPNFQPPGLKHQAFTDFSPFDWKNRLIDESSRFSQNFHSANVSIQQTAWQNRIGLELAYDTQRSDRRSYATFLNGNGLRQTQVRIDMSVMTPEGLPNPNLGRPMLVAENFRYSKSFTDNEMQRATGYLKYDFKDLSASWGKWLGRHTLSGVTERYRVDQLRPQTRVMVAGPNVNTIGADILARQLNMVVYLGPSLIGNNNPLQLNPVQIPQVQFGPAGEISTFVRATGTTDPGNYVRSPASLVEVAENGIGNREVIKSRAVTLQSNWLDDHIAIVLGWRRDTDYNFNRSFNWVDQPLTGPNDPGKADWNFGEMNFPRTPAQLTSVATRSFSIVASWPKKLFRLPRGSDFSVFYNQSENFTPLGSRTDEYGRRIPEPSGDTKEYGFNLSLFNDKLVVRGNIYETAVKNQQYAGLAGSPAMLMNLQTLAAWSELANISPSAALQARVNADIAKLRAAIPANIFDIYQFQVSGAAPNVDASHQAAPPGGRGDTTDFTAKGVEIELVYNPTPNWRILANVAKQETITSNVHPVLRESVERFKALWAELGDRPFQNYPLGYDVGQPLPASTQTLAQRTDQIVFVPLAADLATEGLPTAEQRKWRVNLVTNYRLGRDPIFGERLKGWSIGGGVRWQSSFTLGYPTSRNAAGVPTFHVDRPWKAPADINIDAFVGYGRKIWNDRIDWKVQLHANNLYQPHELIPIQTQPWGQPATMRLAPEQRWYLTNTFTF